MLLLNQHQIRQKVKRLAIQILEQHYNEKELYLVGINNNGMALAKALLGHINEMGGVTVKLIQVRLNPAKPLAGGVELEVPVKELRGKVVIVVDDVANTGRTMYYAMKPLLDTLPKKVETAVLVERHHKSFPVHVEFVGLSLATTLKEDIAVEISEGGEWGVYLR